MSYRARRTDQPSPYAYQDASLPRPETMNQESLAPGRRMDDRDRDYDYDSVSSSDYGEDEQQPATRNAQHRHGVVAQAPPPGDGDAAYYYDANNRRRRRQHHHQHQQQQQQQGGEKSYAGVRDDMLGSGGTGAYQQRNQQQRRAGEGVSFDDDDDDVGRRQRGATQEGSAMRGQGEVGRDAAYCGGQEDPNAHYTTAAAATTTATQAQDQQYGAHDMRPRTGYSEAGGAAPGPSRTGMPTSTTTGASAAGVGGTGTGSDPGPKRRSKRDSTLGRMMEKAGGLLGSQKLEGSGRERREKRASREY